MIRARMLLPAAALVLVLGCSLGRAPATRAPGEEIRVTNDVVVTFSDEVRELPFDTNAARLRAASAQLAAIAGHRVEYGFDRALLPQYREEFEAMLIASIESTAIDLDRLRREHDTFPALAAVLHRIELTYDVAAHEGIGWTSELDVDAKTLRIRLDGDQAAFVPRGLVAHHLAAAEPELLRRRFAGRTVASLEPGEHALYFRHLANPRSGAPSMGYDEPTTAEALREHPALPWLEHAMELHARVEEPKLRSEIADWIADRGGALFYTHLREAPEAVATLPATSPYVRTRGAWVSWIDAHTFALREPTLERLLHRMLRREPDRALGPGEPNPRTLPGLDPLELGFGIADRWIAAGHPREAPGAATHGRKAPAGAFAEHVELYLEVLCPVDASALERPVVRTCVDDLYRYAWKDEPTRERFVAGLLSRGDEPLLRSAVAAILDIGGPKDALELWSRTRRDRAAWTIVAKELALQRPEALGDELVDMAQDLWRREPARRGTLLYLLAQHAREGHRRERFWPTFTEDFGRVDAPTFVTFLEHGPLAVATAWVVWPALGRFPRGPVLADHLDVLLDAPPLDERRGYRSPIDAIDAVIDLMCEEPRRPDPAVMRRALQDRMRRRPEDRKDLVRLELATEC